MQVEQQSWQNIDRLLLACSFDKTTADEQLSRFILALWRSLYSQIGLLFTQEQGYLYCPPKHYQPKHYPAESILEDCGHYLDWHEVKNAIALSRFDAAIIFTQPHQSPYSLAYFFYLAGIPIRVGQSCEFGGRLLSQTVKPLTNFSSLSDYHQHLLDSVGLPVLTESLP